MGLSTEIVKTLQLDPGYLFKHMKVDSSVLRIPNFDECMIFPGAVSFFR